MTDISDLLFFDTFSHESSEELNLDLVQFPKPVYVSEIRIIPLGARVQGDFPGGVRLGATNPTQFHIDFFVNDLSKPGASTFESLGSIDYCQNGQIHMECGESQEPPRRIPTDGLVLRGWYTTITLAVYGTLTKTITEQPLTGPPTPSIQRPSLPREQVPIIPNTPHNQEWNQEANPIPTYTGNIASNSAADMYHVSANYNQENYENPMYRGEYYEPDTPKDPRSYHQIGDSDASMWDKEGREMSCERSRDNERLRHSPLKDIERDRLSNRSIDLDRERRELRSQLRSRSIDRDRGRSRDSSRLRDVDRHDRPHSRSNSRDRDYLENKGDYRPLSGEKDVYRSRSHSPEYRDRERGVSSERDWDRGAYRRHHDSSYERSRAGSFEKRAPSFERRTSPYDKRGSSYERKLLPYDKREQSYDKVSAYDKRTPSYEKRLSPYEKRLSPYEKRGSSYERRATSYEKQLPYDKRVPYDKRGSPYERIRDSNYGSRSPSREDPRKRPRTPPMDSTRRPHTPLDVNLSHDGGHLSPVDSVLSDDGIMEYDQNNKLQNKGEYYHQGYKPNKLSRSSPSDQGHMPLKPTHNYIESQHSSLLTVKVVDGQPSSSSLKLTPTDSPNLGHDDNLSIDTEQFEPILSDEDICDDIDGGYVDVDYEMSDFCAPDDIIKYYNPFKSEWIRYTPVHKYQNKKNLVELKFSEICLLNADFARLYDLYKIFEKREEKLLFQDFADISSHAKEDWVHQCEQLTVLITHITKDSEISLRIVKNEPQNDNNTDEFADIFEFILQFLKIGLHYDFALSQIQPTYKIRHMKCGIRLVEALCACSHSGSIVNALVNRGIDVCLRLLILYSKDYMALSIRLMILKALDTCLASQEAIYHFLQKLIHPMEHNIQLPCTDTIGPVLNGYQILVLLLKKNPSGRVKFAINALLKKLNTYELLKKLHETVITYNKNSSDSFADEQEISEVDIEFIINSLEEIVYVYQSRSFNLSQPKRFLPVSAQFEINKNCSNKVLLDFFQTHKLLETCLFLLSCPLTYNYLVITSPIYELLSELIHSREGLDHLSQNIETSELLFRYLLQPFNQQNGEDSLFYTQDSSNFSDLQVLGLEMAYRLKALYYVQSIFDLTENVDSDESELVDKLQSLFCLCLCSIGKLAVTSVLSMGDNMQCLLNIFEKDALAKSSKGDIMNKQKSPAKSYAVDLTVATVKYSSNVVFLQKYGKRILSVVKKNDLFEQNIASILQEAIPYLKPLERPNVFASDNVGELVEILKSFTESAASLPGEMITALRILKYFGIANYETKMTSICEPVNTEYVELKYKYNILQLYSLDGVMHLVNILEKLCTHYDQPNLHTSTFMSTQGLYIAQTVLPCLQLLNKMLTYVIQCRNTQFKDLTAVPIILQTYSLMRSYPPSAIGHKIAQKACRESILTLLAYTQPIAEEATENECIHKTLWTLLCTEVIKYTLTAPYTFVPGLLIFSELLPLPLPIPTKFSLSESEVSNMVNNRKLWSAHLHTLANNITEMIQTICISAYQPVTQMLRRVCVQIADLASNMAIIVARAVLTLIVTEVCGDANTLPPVSRPSSFTTSRLLSFLACLVAHASVKSTVLHLIRQSSSTGKGDDRHWLIVPILCNVLATLSDTPVHLQAQECVTSIISSFCDTEVTLMSQMDVKSELKPDTKSNLDEMYLSNSLPHKDILTPLIVATFDCLSSENCSFVIISSVLRIYFMLTEHDFGFYHFKLHLMKHKHVFVTLFHKLVKEVNKDGMECLSMYLELFRILQIPSDDLDSGEVVTFVPRTSVLTPTEVAEVIGYMKTSDQHPIITLESLLKEQNTDEDIISNAAFLATAVQNGVENEQDDIPVVLPEIILPPADTLMAQFNARTLSIPGDPHDERLCTRYWLNMPSLTAGTEEEINEGEMVACDVSALANVELAASEGAAGVLSAAMRLLGAATTPRDTIKDGALHTAKPRAVSDSLRDKRPFVSAARIRIPGYASPTATSGPVDAFRSRPPNTSRPPSLHVDDFVALEGRGAQPTGPTGYNKITAAAVAGRGRGLRARGIAVADRGRFASATPQPALYRQSRGRGAWGAPDLTSASPHFPAHFAPNNQYVIAGNGWNNVGTRIQRGHRALRHSRTSFMR